MRKYLHFVIFTGLVSCVFFSQAQAATFSVDRTDNSSDSLCTAAPNDCSLKGAIMRANIEPTDDVINFDGLPPVITSTITFSTNVPGGQDTFLTIQNNGSLEITGAGRGIVITRSSSTSSSTSRIIQIEPSANVIFREITITKGSIFNPNGGSLGGGVLNRGNLTLFSVTLNGNTVLAGSGGGIANAAAASGSPIPVLTINNSVISNNVGGNDNPGGFNGSGAGVFNGGILYINNSTISGNRQRGGFGGALLNTNYAIITNTDIDSNISGSGGTFNPFNGHGGGIYNSGSLELQNSTVRNNLASELGGGIANYNTMIINNSTVSGNRSYLGTGIFTATATLATEITNSTIVNNSVGNPGGGIYTLVNTIPSKIRNTILAGNTSADIVGTVESLGYNLIKNQGSGVITGNTTGNIIGQDPSLGALANNGGATLTHALLAGSPAIDRADPNNFPPTDQRGSLRPVDGDSNGSILPDIGAFEVSEPFPFRKTRFDFDGNGKADVSVFRPSNGAWYIQQSTAGFTGVTFGFGTDKIVPADYDGDGRTDIAVFRPSNGGWYYLRSSDNNFVGLQWGQNGDIPIPGDFDGDGKADINIFRPSDGGWYRLNSSNNQFVGNAFGQNGDVPLLGDFNGDGKSDLAVFRPSAGYWYIARTTGIPAQNFDAVPFGYGTDIPTPADYDGDGKTDVSVFRPSNGGWYRINSSDGSAFGVAFGQNGDIPVAADYDGDGKANLAVFRPSANSWYIAKPTGTPAQNFDAVPFGFGTDKPIPSAFQ